MPHPRPRHAAQPSTAVRVARVAVPLALVGLGTSAVVAFDVPGSDAQTAVPAPTASAPDVSPLEREQPLSRDLDRTPSPAQTPTADGTTGRSKLTARVTHKPQAKPARPAAAALAAHPKVWRTMWSTDAVKIRAEPSKGSDAVTVVSAGTRLSVTATVRDGFRLVAFRGKGRWVTTGYLSTTKPKPRPKAEATAKSKVRSKTKASPVASGGVSRAACSKGSAMESGLTPDAVLVHRTLCARYPQITSFGGTRGGGGFHATGQAVDCMISSSRVGWEVARWVRAHARQLGVSEVIYAQHIWTVQRSGEGWRSMSDRGSRTANHYDHVHVSVYGHRAG